MDAAPPSLVPPPPSSDPTSAEARPPRVLGRRLGIVAAALVLAAGAVALGRRGAEPPAPIEPAITADARGVTLHPGAPQWKYVRLAAATASPPLAPLPAPGRVELDERRSARVGSPLAGRVERVLVRLGDRVQAGDRLFSVRSGALADLHRELSSAEEAVQLKRKNHARAQELLALAAAPEKDVLAAAAELKEAELALRAASAKLQSLAVAPEADNLFWVKAPQAGTLVDLDVSASQEVTPDREQPLLRIADLAEVLVIADVQDTDAADLKIGGQAEVQLPAIGLTRAGTVEHISELVDPKRRSVEIRVRVKNEDRALRANAFVEVTFTPPSRDGRVQVPAEAVVTDGNRAVVFVAKAEGRLEPVPVQPGRQRDGQVELRAGLEPGMRYVSRGALLLLNQIDLAD